MYNEIMNKIEEVDCALEGVAYDVKETFLLPTEKGLYFVAAISDSYANDKPNHSYSVYDVKKKTVLAKNSKEYKCIVKDLPPCEVCRPNSAEMFKSWEFHKIFKGIVDSIADDGTLPKVQLNAYKEFLTHKRNLVGGPIYNYLLLNL